MTKTGLLAVVIIMGLSWMLASLAWWSFVIPAVLVGFLFSRRIQHPFFSGMGAVALLFLMLLLPTTIQNDNLLLNRVSGMFSLPGWALLIISVGLPALLGGLAAWSGSAFAHAFQKGKVK